MPKSEFDPSLVGLLQYVDYGVLTMLKVHALRSERQKDQKIVIGIINEYVQENPELAKRFSKLLRLLQNQSFNDGWDNKRHLGHVQRCVSSGDDNYFIFAMELLSRVNNVLERHSPPHKVLFSSEGWDTQMAWTVAPLLISQGRSYKQIMKWVATGSSTETYGIHLKGLRGLPIRQPFVIPDRVDSLYRTIDPNSLPVYTHPNYTAAQALAIHLVATGMV